MHTHTHSLSLSVSLEQPQNIMPPAASSRKRHKTLTAIGTTYSSKPELLLNYTKPSEMQPNVAC